jgi:ribosomal protein S18 acetylase RimI-like enzyme
MIRRAFPTDIADIQRIRNAVRENRLVSTVITDEDVRVMLEDRGRGWVAEVDGAVVGFAIGDATNGNVWALFVDPAHEGRGHGRALHDAMVA